MDPGTEQIHNQEGFPTYSKLATARPVEQRIVRVPIRWRVLPVFFRPT